MTDRVKGVVVTFDKDIREDDVEGVLSAIRLLGPVVSVEPVGVDIHDSINRSRVRMELMTKLLDVLNS